MSWAEQLGPCPAFSSQQAPAMDVCLSSAQQPGHRGEGLSSPGGWLEAEKKGASQKDSTGGALEGNLLLHHFNSCPQLLSWR